MSTKKQQIILTHGSGMPQESVIQNLALGEVLVQHADSKEASALHFATNIKGENESVEKVLVSVPSQEWVKQEIAALDYTTTMEGINGKFDAINKDIEELVKTDGENLQAAKDYADIAVKGLKDGEVKANADAIKQEILDRAEAVKGVNDDLQGYKDSVADTFDGLKNIYVNKEEHAQLVGELEADIAAAKTTLTVADPEFGIKVAKTTDESDSHDNYELTLKGVASQGQIDDIVDRLDVIESLDENESNSMRSIAKSAAATAVAEVVANAPDSYDTLKEIADFITNDTTGAAGMANDISDIKTVLGDYMAKDAEGNVTANAVKKAIESIEDTFKNYTTTEDLEGIVDGLEAEIAKAKTEIVEAEGVTVTDGQGFGIKVAKSEAEGDKHDVYTFTLENVAKASDLSTLDGRVEDIEDVYAVGVKFLKNGAYEKVTIDSERYIDLSGLVIDGGEY